MLPALVRRTDLKVDGVAKVYVDYARRVGETPSGSPFFAVPVEFRLLIRRGCLKRLGSAGRAYVRQIVRRYAQTPSLCLNDYDNGGQESCATQADALRGKLVTLVEDNAPRSPMTSTGGSVPLLAAGLVPDTFTSVSARYPNETRQASITNNFFSYVHQLVIAPTAKRVPNLNPDLLTYTRTDGSTTAVRPAPERPTPG